MKFELTPTIAAIFACAIGLTLGALLVNPALQLNLADIVTAATAVAALIVGVATIERQRSESLLQRQMQTVQLQNGMYDKLFDDIYALRLRQSKPTADEMRSIYNRYFTAVMTGLRHYKAELVPRSDFIEWTAILVSRLYEDECLVAFDEQDCIGIREQWNFFDQRTYGPKVLFRWYMSEALGCAKSLPEGLNAADRHAACDKIAAALVAQVDAR